MKRTFLALIPALIISSLAYLGFRFMPDSSFSRLFVLMGGNILSGGYIQFFLYLLFFRGTLEIGHYFREVREESGAMKSGILSEKEQYVYYGEDINELKLLVIEEEEVSPRTLFRLVKMGATKYLRTGSVTEVLEIITAQVRIIQNRMESGHSIIRYTAWALPALGFLGTVWGISSALGVARKVVQEGDISEITSKNVGGNCSLTHCARSSVFRPASNSPRTRSML